MAEAINHPVNPLLPVQLHTKIFDPSLITPHYGINDIHPANPFTDLTTDLLTLFLQAIPTQFKQTKTIINIQ